MPLPSHPCPGPQLRMTRAVGDSAQGGAVVLSHPTWAQLPCSSWSAEQQCWYLGHFSVGKDLPPADLYKVRL